MKRRARISFQLAQFIALVLVTFGTTYAQSETANKSSIEILKLKWEKQTRLPGNFDPSTIPDNGVFSTMESRTSVPGSTQAPLNDQAARDAANRSAALAPVDYFPKTPSRMPVFYVYSLTMRNIGAKTIQAVAWDYVFINPNSQMVVGSHHLVSYGIVKAGQRVTLKAAQRTRPISVISAPAVVDAKHANQKLLETAVIQCVLYQDQTRWQSPARDGACELLRKNQPFDNQKRRASRD